VQAVIEYWQALERRARVGLVLGVLVILGVTGGMAVWAYRPDYQVLFADLAPRDAAAMTAELDKMKVEYKLGGNGTSILVPREIVYRTRLKLMGGDMPLQGAVGFEVFNNAELGMTEFVQRINYLRAVQGELTRTIQSIDGIQSARVHLAIPEQGLFKKSATKPKASVTLALKNREQLSPQQISGIQRLVAASVPDIAAQDVTVLDQHGVALTRAEGGDPHEIDGARLEVKRSTEDYLQKKIDAVLDRTFGAGEAMASVDVVLAAEHGTVTTEEVLPARSGTGESGVVVHERSSVQDSPANTASATEHGAASATNSSETDYQVGRRVEQRTVPSGDLKRMTIAVVVRQRLDGGQVERLRDVVALAAGLNTARGDAIVVSSIDQLANPVPAVVAAPLADTVAPAAAPSPVREAAAAPAASKVVLVLAALLTVVLAGGIVFLLRKRQSVARQAAIARLDDAARAQMLSDVRRWIANADTADVVKQQR
jgi:flagellar M-ring protein FliF